MSRSPPALLALLLFAGACPPDKGDTASGSSTGGATSGADTTGVGTTEATGEPTTGEPLGPECQRDSDCVLINNCCECSSRPVGEQVPPCEGNCLQPTCEAMSLGGIAVACRSGICEFADVQCSEGPPTCNAVKPSCPPDTRISIVGDCWGPCVPPRYCEGEPCTADSCGAGWLCARHQVTPSVCAPIPRECGDSPDCTCAGPYLDEFCPGSCVDDGGTLTCQDGG